MYIEKDYIMRLVHEIIRTLRKLLCGVDIDEREPEVAPEQKELYLRLKRMIEEGNVNEAENLLAEQLDGTDRADFQLALLFYAYLNKKDDCFLQQHGFSREEIMEGIKYASGMYGYGSIADTFLEEI